MEYIYAALLLHKAGKEINEDNLKKVLEAAGVSVDIAKVKSVIASLEGVNIEEAVKKAVSMPSGGVGEEKKEEKKEEEKKEEEKKSEEEAAAGLGALFG